MTAEAGDLADRRTRQPPRPVLRPGNQRGAVERGRIARLDQSQLRSEVEPAGQRGRSCHRERIALGAIRGGNVRRQLLLVIERGNGQHAVAQRDHAGAVADRHDELDRMFAEARQRLEQPVGDALGVEPPQSVMLDRCVGPDLAVDQPPVARPQADLAQGLADVDHNGETQVQRLSPQPC
jgi:hypothetical protein